MDNPTSFRDGALPVEACQASTSCRALCLKKAHSMRPVVTPSRCEVQPGFGGGGEMLLAEEQLT